ncbi:GDSL esterase/lipase 5 isoform X1 [Apium graveolens]|uniref:GDSL esterase/lipase 5 isoform X1 n=1 Tax=Apium graveolens TaxID=4045 RepID=UPI003D7A0632
MSMRYSRVMVISLITHANLMFALILILLFIRSSSNSRCLKAEQPVGMFVFGDSYFDPGNNNYINTSTLDQANFPPYGLSFLPFPTGRFSDGRLVSDFIGEYAKLPLLPPFLQPGINRQRDFYTYNYGMNFASAGAGCLLETFQGYVIGLDKQLEYYKKAESGMIKNLGYVEAKKRSTRAVYLFSIGTNDYTSLFLTNSILFTSTSHSKYVASVIGNLTTVITEIYKRGGRKFGFLNLGPLGCYPGLRILKPEPANGSRQSSCLDEEVSLLAKLHNKQLSKSLSSMRKLFPDFKYTLFDFHTFLQARIMDPVRYGFKEGKAACCGSGWLNGRFSCGGKRGEEEYEVCNHPHDHVFWDSYHFTQSLYQQMASHMWTSASYTNHFGGGQNHTSKLITSYNLKTLFHCL